MAMKKTGLGKGLDALFSTGPLEEDKEEEKVVEKVDESEKIHKIKIITITVIDKIESIMYNTDIHKKATKY